MARTAGRFDTLAALKQLSLARNRESFARNLEQLAAECVGGGRARFYRFRSQTGTLLRPWESPEGFPLGEDTLPGRAGMYMEYLVDRERLPVPGLDAVGSLAVAMPLRHYGAMMGVLAIAELSAEPVADELAALDKLGELAGLTWEAARMTEDHSLYAQRVEDLLVGATESLSDGAGHTARVARLATELAKMMDLSSQSRNLIWRAALYHDVGKLVLAGRPPAQVQQEHPGAGAEFLRSGRVLRDLAPVVEAHHERYDGSGFPYGKKGEEVPIEGWVLALAEHLIEDPSARADGEKFLRRHMHAHHPAVIDALGGLIVSFRLEELL